MGGCIQARRQNCRVQFLLAALNVCATHTRKCTQTYTNAHIHHTHNTQAHTYTPPPPLPPAHNRTRTRTSTSTDAHARTHTHTQHNTHSHTHTHTPSPSPAQHARRHAHARPPHPNAHTHNRNLMDGCFWRGQAARGTRELGDVKIPVCWLSSSCCLFEQISTDETWSSGTRSTSGAEKSAALLT